ncbi:MAG: DNA recombination protein RmuC [Phycisphaerae bacterium]
MTWFVIGFIVGALIGAGLAVCIGLVRARQSRAQLRDVEQQMRETFAALSAEALDANAKRLSEQNTQLLDGKKALIDQSVQAVNERLEQVRGYLQKVESERSRHFGQLSSSVSSLATTTGQLHRMLASTQRRGMWGERMAEDILRLAGLQEHVNYVKQDAEQADSGRPDFTFFLPNELRVNMDVKFPLERYKAYLECDGDAEKRRAELKNLVQAVRGHIRAVAGRGYIDTKGGTVPYVIVFIPAEPVYGLVLEAQPDLIDEALAQRVVLASPLTLYAMLAVVRQAAESANIMKTADQVLELLGQFNAQWDKYNEEVEKLGDRLDSARKQYETVTTTRTNMLQRPLDKIDDLRAQRDGVPKG